MKEKELAKLYHNTESVYSPKKCNLEDFLIYDNLFNKEAGVYEIDKSMKTLKEILNNTINDIINDIEIKTNFNF